MNLEIYKLLDVKIKSILKIINEENDLNNIYLFYSFNNTLIKSTGDVQVYLDYEDDNGVHNIDFILTTEELKSLDSIYNKINILML